MIAWTKSPRIAIYSHDTYGLGHLTRSTRVAVGMSQSIPGASVLILTGSPIAHRFAFPAGVDYVKLPSVVKSGPDRYSSRELTISGRRVRRMRTQIILNSLEAFRPNLLLVDNVPLGMKGELLPALEALRRRGTQIHLNLRDILDDPEVIRRSWREQGIPEALDRLYDAIHVFGAREIFDACAAYDLPAGKSALLGYIRPPASPAAEILSAPDPGERTILVTIGGGGDGGEMLMQIGRLQRLLGPASPYRFIVAAGPLMDELTKRRVMAALRHLPGVRVHEYVDALPDWMGRCDLVLSRGGYNTLCEVMARARRSIVVPRTEPRREQVMRAQALEARGIVRVLDPEAVTPAGLEDALRKALEAPPISREKCPPLNGIERLRERVRDLLLRNQALRQRRAAWRAAGPAGLAAFLITLLSLGCLAGNARAEMRPDRAQASLGFGYDSNLLDASDAERDAFEANDPGTLFVVDRMEDLLLRARLEADWKLGKPLGLKTKLRASFQRQQVLYNPIKSTSELDLALKTALRDGTDLSLSVGHQPQIYGRHRLDKDARPGDPMFRAETQRRWDLDVTLDHELGPRWSATLELGRTWKDYNQAFVERDRREVSALAGVAWRPSSRVELGLAGGYGRSVSRNEPDLQNDLSHREWIVEPRLGLYGVLPFMEIEITYEMEFRRYTTGDPEDWNHFGRNDRLGELELDLVRSLRGPVSATVEVAHRWRSADISESLIDYDEEGSSSEYVVISGLTWLWEQ